MAKLLDGKALASKLNLELCEEIGKWVESGHKKPHLTCLLVGDNNSSAVYVKNKELAASQVGISTNIVKLNSNVSQSALLDKINALNNNCEVDGILVQLPLPEGINEQVICNAILPSKDVDGFHQQNVGRFCLDLPSILPCTPLGVLELLKHYKIDTFGRSVVVVGRSKHVGMPLAILMQADGAHESRVGMDATVTMCNRYTPPDLLTFYCRNADIIITATGVKGLIKADMVKPGATVVDIGIIRTTDVNGKPRLVGDVDFEAVSKVAGYITPVPGGVGPMTVAMLMKNTFAATKHNAVHTNGA